MTKKTLILASIFFSSLCKLYAQSEFITRWNLSFAGSSLTQISFEAGASGVVSYDWESYPNATLTGAGTFTGGTFVLTGLPINSIIRLKINPLNFQSIKVNYSFTNNDGNRLVDIEQWGITNWTTMKEAYKNCANLQISATDIPNLSNVTTTSSMFESCSILNSPLNINNWNVSNVKDFRLMFSNTLFNQPIGDWDVSNATTFEFMFQDTPFNQPIGNWNVAKATNMRAMFIRNASFNQPIGIWNVTSVGSMRNMFLEASAFNQPLGSWDISNTNQFNGMFFGATSFNQSLASWASKFNPSSSFYEFTGSAGFLQNSGLSVANYDAFLVALNTNTITGTRLGANNLKYCGSDAARASLQTKGWILEDAGVAGIPTFPTGLNTTICVGTTPPILSTISSEGIIGTWSPSIVSNTISGNYTFTSGCGTSTTFNVSVVSNIATAIVNQPSNQSVNNNGLAFFSVSVSGVSPFEYLWNNGSTLSGFNTSVLGSYMVTVTGKCGSKAVSNAATLTTELLELHSILKHISIYPNPSEGNFTIQNNATKNVSYIISDVIGKKIMEGTFNVGENKITILQKGIYFLHIGNQVQKLMVE